jgi:hypothetical protein
VWCGTCGTEGPPEEAEAAAIAAWNRRAGHTAAAERIAGLEAENARLRETLERIAFLSCNGGGWFERDEWAAYCELGNVARAALEPRP